MSQEDNFHQRTKDRDKVFGLLLTRARVKKGFSQDELARKIPCSQQLISNYERGKSLPSYQVVLRMAYLLGIGERKMREAVVQQKLEAIKRRHGFR